MHLLSICALCYTSPCNMNIQQQEKTSLILHGHFYQPPRENPQTGIIGKQLSASPFPDWNERIHADCYSANSHSRYLSAYRRILSMTNNYASISFNFGPTLLSWMQKQHPETYELILQADRQSVERLGFGNAIAQAFNHSILPLCTKEDARTQILWGLDDFNRRFGRAAQGLWLSETAINPMVIDLLAESGVTFVILSPWQCRAISKDESSIQGLNGKPAPYDRPFLLQGKSGKTVNAFFYNHQLAEGISFGHYLRDADQLYERLLTIKTEEKAQLIHTATDGEIYGHHEPYGDMALAALIKKVEDRDDFSFTNYAAYLSEHPATEWAHLHEGEEERGTSWSCSHGVSRWYRDCGCHTGGDESWNQKWRTPLRKAFDHLSQNIDTIFFTEVKRLLGPQVEALSLLYAFAPVASGQMEMETFLAPYSNDPSVREQLAKLLLAQKYKHFAYTSCGWFFNDLAGLEPRQNITYALMAVQLCQRFSTDELMMTLLDDLSKAKANRKQDGNGQNLAMESLQQLRGEVEAALFFTLNRRIAKSDDYRDSYGYFTLESYSLLEDQQVVLTLLNKQSLVRYICTAVDLHPELMQLEYSITVQNTTEGEEQTYYLDHDDIHLRMRDALFDQIDRTVCSLDQNQIKQLSRNLYHYASLATNIPYLPMGALYQELIGSTLQAIKSLFMYGSLSMWDEFKKDFELMLDFFLKYGKQPDLDLIKTIFDTQMWSLAEKIQTFGLYDQNSRFILEFLEIIRKRGYQPDLTAIQDAIYPYMSMQKRLPPSTDANLINTLGTMLNFELTIKET